ncbi:MAG: IS1380 family transposase, partial [Burkholderiales bacterium]
MNQDTGFAFDLPAVGRKKVSAAFDGGMLSSDGGVLLLRGVERRLGIAARLAACLSDRRAPERIAHPLVDMLRLRMFAIAAGYADADDCDALRTDPVFKMAVGRGPGSGAALCSQPTMSRLENAPSKIALARMMAAMVDLFCASYRQAPAAIVLDIDDTLDRVHGQQQLSLFNAHYDEHCFLPIHIYEGNSGKPVAMILRAGKTPSGIEVRTILKRVIAGIRKHWPTVRITVRGDSHYGRHEAMEWCEDNDIDYIFGLGGNAVLRAGVGAVAGDLCVRRAESAAEKLRGWTALSYGAKGWKTTRRVVARLEATQLGLDIRYVVTSLSGTAEHLYETVYCARGQAENFIKLHKAQLASDRTSCRSPLANQFRLILHTAAYWLLHTLRAAVPRRSSWARA